MADNVTLENKQRELRTLKERVAALEADLAAEAVPPDWRPVGFYSAY